MMAHIEELILLLGAFVGIATYQLLQTSFWRQPKGMVLLGIFIFGSIGGCKYSEKIEEDKWHFAENEEKLTGSKEGYCAYLAEYPQGEYFRQAQIKCHPQNVASAVKEASKWFEPEMVQLPDGSWMGKYEVTIGEYMQCVDYGGCRNPLWLEVGSDYNINTGYYKDYATHGMSLENKRHPMTGVSWDDTQKYITWLNEKTGKTYRLPTEEEWFSACQAGKTTKYCGGENIDLVAWHYGNSGGTTHEVGQKAKNEWGLYDMSGNVSEWTDSSYIAINSKMIRVVRGWSWVDVDESSVMRFGTPDNRFYHIGFRLARL